MRYRARLPHFISFEFFTESNDGRLEVKESKKKGKFVKQVIKSVNFY